MNRDSSKSQPPLNAAAFVAKKREDVSVDEVFFHKYFSQAGQRKVVAERKSARKLNEPADYEQDNDEEKDEDIWRAIVGSRRELGEGEQDDDDDDDDLELDESNASTDDSDLDIPDDTSDLAIDLDGSSGGEAVDDGLEILESVDASFAQMEGNPLKTQQSMGSRPGAGPDGESRRQKRRKLKSLPTFASADDYASMLAGEDER